MLQRVEREEDGERRIRTWNPVVDVEGEDAVPVPVAAVAVEVVAESFHRQLRPTVRERRSRSHGHGHSQTRPRSRCRSLERIHVSRLHLVLSRTLYRGIPFHKA